MPAIQFLLASVTHPATPLATGNDWHLQTICKGKLVGCFLFYWHDFGTYTVARAKSINWLVFLTRRVVQCSYQWIQLNWKEFLTYP